MNSYDKEVIFHLPGAFEYYQLYMNLLQLIEENPDILKDNVKIGSIYGSPSGI